MRKLASVLVCLAILASIAAPALAAGGKPVLTVWVPENLRIEDYNTNQMTLWLEEQGNFDLNIVTQPAGADYATKINMALTAGNVADLPDVIVQENGKFTDTQIWEWAQAGTILPLTQYYDDPALAVNINEAKERTGLDYTQQITSPDGNLSGIATLNQSYGNEYPDKGWYSLTWLETLGEKVPETTEEFYQLLKKVHETDLNGNGKADEIGLAGTFGESKLYGGWFNYLMNPFVYSGDKWYRTVEDGKVGVAYATEAWKEGLKYMRRLFAEGLIASESLTMDNDQFKALMNSADQVVFSLVYYAPDMLNKDGGRVTEYRFLAPLAGPDGARRATFTQSAANVTFIVTANCKNPEAAFRLGDLMSSELIGITQRWGTQGSEWDYIANVADAEKYVASVRSFPVSIVTYHDAQFWGGSDVANASWRQVGPYVRHYGIAGGVGVDPAKTEQYTILLNGAWEHYQQGGYRPEEVIPKVIYTSDEAEVVSEITSNLKSFVDEQTAAFLMGNADIDAGWGAFQAELENIGLSTFLEIQQAVYDRMYK
ncbi:MAG TPA: hypothetical protein VLA21_02170 [Candidatus Limnocylindria bacterium]|nr:hypothetical protein [Candidatus Limnocylindria bacterium]